MNQLDLFNQAQPEPDGYFSVANRQRKRKPAIKKYTASKPRKARPQAIAIMPSQPIQEEVIKATKPLIIIDDLKAIQEQAAKASQQPINDWEAIEQNQAPALIQSIADGYTIKRKWNKGEATYRLISNHS